MKNMTQTQSIPEAIMDEMKFLKVLPHEAYSKPNEHT